ncbi:MAG: hypothetical protein IPJ65_17430 [Archangiaceae bacterium]|nr:hypothetical protein [Archangiaceae bacterium]
MMRVRWARVALLLLAVACTKPGPAPTLSAIAPDRGPADRDVQVTISGERLAPVLVTDFSRRSGSVLDASYQARLGREALRDVKLNEDGTLTATVPQGISPGTYDLIVTTPATVELKLDGAYRVLAANEVGDLVRGFRFDAIAPQQVGVPFTITVTAIDQVGVPVDTFAGTAALTDLTGSAVPHQIGPFARGAWSGLAEVRALHAADVLTATLPNQNQGSSNAFPVSAGAGVRLVFATPPRSAAAGSCSEALTVQGVDATSTPSPATMAVPLQLTASPANGFTLFADASCTVPLSAPALAPGQSALTFHFKGTRAGPVQLAAVAAGFSPAAQTETVTPGAASRLVFVTPDPTLNSGSCSSDVTLQARDAFDNPAPVAAAAAVTLDVMPALGLELFETGGCATPLTGFGFAAGASTADFRLRGGAAGAFTVVASSASLGSAMLRVRVNPAGFPTQLVIVSTPQTVMVGTCSGPLAVQSQDAAGNAVITPGALPVTLSASPATGFQLFDDAACSNAITQTTLGVSTSTNIVYFRGTVSGAVTVTAASSGLQSGLQTENLTPGPANRLTFTSAPQTVRAGTCSGAVDLGLLDSLDNPAVAAATLTVSLAAAPSAGVTFYSDPACTTLASSFDIAAASATGRLFFRGTVATLEVLTASSPGFTSATQTETVTPGVPAAVVFTSAPQAVGLNACSSAATVEVRDAFGNVSPVSAATPMTLSALPAAGLTFFSDPGCGAATSAVTLSAAASTASFFFRSSALGGVTVTASPAGLAAASQLENIVAGAAAKLAFTTPARSATAGSCSAAVTVTVQDASNNPSPVPAARMVSLTAPGLSLFSDPSCATASSSFTLAIGQSSGTFYFRSNAAAAYPVTASSVGLTDGAQTETVTPAAADRLAFVTPPRTSSAGACSAVVTVARKDAFGNDTPGAAATVGLSAAPSTGFTFYSDAACTAAVSAVALANGAAQASFYFIGTMAAGELLTASSAPLTPASQAATVTAAAAPTQLVFTTPARTITANGCSAALSVQSRDSFNNPRSVSASTPVAFGGASATFYSDAGCTAAVTQLSIAASADTVTFYFRATAAGPLPVIATAAGLNPASQTQTVTAAAPDRVVFTSGAQTLTAGGCSALATVQPRDAFGNPSAPAVAQTVALTSGAGVTFYSDATCTALVSSTTLNAGALSAGFYFKGTQAGVRSLSAAVTGWVAGTQNATFNPAGATQLVFTTPARSVAAGACSAVLTVEARDTFGNTTTVGPATNVALAAAPAAGFTFWSNATCTTAAGTPQIPAGGSTVSFYVRGTAVGTVGVTATAAGLPGVSQNVTVTAGAAAAVVFVTPGRSAVAGTCSQVLTVELRDASNNPTPAPGGGTVLNLAAAPATGFAFHPTTGCGGAVASVTVAAGATQASFAFRGTSVGTIGVTVSGAGLTSANQNQTVTPAAAASFAWDPVGNPRALNTAFGVTVRARDAFGNAATAFTGTAALSMGPAGTVSCTSACTNATTTDVFAAGVWSGTVTLTTFAAVGSGRSLTATQGAVNGTSNTFTVTGPAARTPPIARFTWSPAVIDTGGTVSFDASPSSDYQTPSAQLQVTFDPENDGNFSAFTTTKTFSHRYNTAGLYRVRMEVRDTDGDIDYRSGWVRVLNPGDPRCTVNTASDVDDGASNCTSAFGTDGKLSLAEAIRISNGTGQLENILFASTMTITSTGSYTISADTDVYAQPGVILVGKTMQVPNGTTLNIFGLEMSGQTSPFLLSGNGNVTLTDVYFHNMAGVRSTQGTLTLEQVRLASCTGPCVEKQTNTTGVINLRYSELRASPLQPAVQISGCPGTGTVLDMFSNTITDFTFGVRLQCNGTALVRHNTFDQVATGVAYAAGAGHVLQNNIFTNSSTTAATCGTAAFTTKSHHQLFGNASNGCVAGDPNTLTSDPQYAFASADDLRLAFGSSAINSAFDTGLDVCLGFPGNFEGSGADRGGRESY